MALGAVAADLVLLIAVICAVQRRLIYFPLPEKLARAGPLPVLCARQRPAYWRAAARVQRPAGSATQRRPPACRHSRATVGGALWSRRSGRGPRVSRARWSASAVRDALPIRRGRML